MVIISVNHQYLHPLSPSSHGRTYLIPSTAVNLSLFSSVTNQPLHCSSLSVLKFSITLQKSQLTLLGLPLSKRWGLFQCNTLTATNAYGDIITDSGNSLYSLFLQMGFDGKAIQTVLDNHPALKQAPFESIRTRIHRLQNLGIIGLFLFTLIKKRPDVLVAKEIDSFVCFISDDLEGIIDVAQLERLFIATDTRSFSGFDAKVRLLLSLGIPREKLAYVLNNVNLSKALCLRPYQEIERMMAFLDRFDGIELILRRPAILNYDLDTQLIPRIGFLLEVSGGDKVATATVLRKLPTVLAYTEVHLKEHVELLRSFAGLSNEQIFKIILVYPNLFSASRDRKLKPRIDFLKQCGLSSIDISKFLVRAPVFLSLSFEVNLAPKLGLLVKLGYEPRTKELAMAMGASTRSNAKNMQEVISLLLDYGLSCEDVLAMAKKHYQVLQYNHKSLKVKLDYLIEEMGREIGELLSFPAFLGYGFDGRIKHRFEVKGKHMGDDMSINKLLSMSTATFSKRKTKKSMSKVVKEASEDEVEIHPVT